MYIDPYLSQSELSAQASFRTLLKEIGKNDVYHVHGSKLFPRNRRTETSGRGHGCDQRGDDSRQSHDPSGGSRHQGNLPYVRSPESGRRGQRLRDGRSTSIDRSHGSSPESGRRVSACVQVGVRHMTDHISGHLGHLGGQMEEGGCSHLIDRGIQGRIDYA